MRALALGLLLFSVADVARAQPLAYAEVSEPAAEERLELALVRADGRFDPVRYLSVQRSLLVAIFESYCALGFLLPPSESRLEIGLGIGCLAGVLTTSIMAWRQIARPSTDVHDRLAEFRVARAEGAEDLIPRFEAGLRAQARRDRRKRYVGGVLGILNLVATGVLATLVARGHLARNTGTAIATGTGAVAVFGLADFFVRSPSEQALALYE